MSYFEFQLGKGRDTVRLVSVEPSRHMNVVLGSPAEDFVSRSVTAQQARELRDALIEAYPIAVEVEKSPYEAFEGSVYDNQCNNYVRGWHVGQNVPSTERKLFAHTPSEETAKKIAQALNEAEGL